MLQCSRRSTEEGRRGVGLGLVIVPAIADRRIIILTHLWASLSTQQRNDVTWEGPHM